MVPEPDPTQRNDFRNILLVTLIILVAYLNACRTGVIPLDDGNLIKAITAFNSSFLALLTGNGEKYFRPVAYLSYLMDARLYRADPIGIHFTNIAIHAANSVLVYLIALRLTLKRPKAAMAAALIFGLHPVNSEAVIWISARYDLLSCFFFLATLLLITRRRADASSGPLFFPVIFLTFLGSLLSKESSILFPLALVPFLVNERPAIRPREAAAIMGTLMVALALYLFLRNGLNIAGDKGIGGSLTASAERGIGTTLVQCMAATGFYIRKMLYPFPLNFAISSIPLPQSLLLYALFSATAALLFHRSRELRFPLALMATALIPPLFAMVGKLAWTPYAERYLYTPIAGCVLLISVSCARHIQRLPRTLLILSVLLLAGSTALRVRTWSDPATFWEEAIARSPRFGTPHLLLATVLLEHGRVDDAERHLALGRKLGFPRTVDEQYADTLQTALRDARIKKAAPKLCKGQP